MSPFGFEVHFFAVLIYGRLVFQQCCYGLERYSEVDVLAVAYASLYASAVVRSCGYAPVVIEEEVVHFASASGAHAKSCSKLNAFHGVYAQHGTSEGCMQLVKLGLSESCRAAFYHARNCSAYGVALSLNLRNKLYHLFGFSLVGASYNVFLGRLKVVFPVVAVESDGANL